MTELVYHCSQAISAFLNRSRGLIKEVLINEVSLQTNRSTFIYKNYTYPINIVAFEHSKTLGCFKGDLLEIGLNKALMFYNDQFLKEIIRHEIAHYLVYIEYGSNCPHHGIEFHTICRKYGWKEEMKATINNNSLKEKKPQEILKKVTKLIELSKSANIHESQLAMNKARELLIKHQLEYVDESESHIIKRVLVETRVSQKMRCISEILKLFFVHPVINYGKKQIYLEILGREVHVEIAEFITAFLYRKFEELWKKEKQNNLLSGLRAKNSFFRGITKGFVDKQRLEKNSERALLIIQNDLQEAIKYAYPRLTKSVSKSKGDQKAFSKGEKIGKNLSIESPIKNHTNTTKLLKKL